MYGPYIYLKSCKKTVTCYPGNWNFKVLAGDEGKSAFKFRALPGQGILRLCLSDSRCEKEESVRLIKKGFLL